MSRDTIIIIIFFYKIYILVGLLGIMIKLSYAFNRSQELAFLSKEEKFFLSKIK